MIGNVFTNTIESAITEIITATANATIRELNIADAATSIFLLS
jgi:hypothetical protein